MKAKHYDDLFDKYIRAKKVYESIVLIKNGTGDTIFSKAYGGKTIDSPIIVAQLSRQKSKIFIMN